MSACTNYKDMATGTCNNQGCFQPSTSGPLTLVTSINTFGYRSIKFLACIANYIIFIKSRLTIVSREAKKKQPYATNE